MGNVAREDPFDLRKGTNMSTTLNSPPAERLTKSTRTNAPPIPTPAHTDDRCGLANDLERLRAEEQARIDRARQEELARVQELARFD
jgi:hypothetical protein